MVRIMDAGEGEGEAEQSEIYNLKSDSEICNLLGDLASLRRTAEAAVPT